MRVTSRASDYFITTVYRLLAVSTPLQRFEDEALYTDPRIAEKQDFDFVYGLKLLQKAATDASLFQGICYNPFKSKDRIVSNTSRVVAESYWK